MDARTQRRLRREAVREEEEEEEEEVMISIPISDIREILHAKRETHKATKRGMALGEINYQLWKIQKICEKYIK
tara:strand:+ start:840 stop:1061 length:222 start_codon:yes stop_codon:yes gene_type:complete